MISTQTPRVTVAIPTYNRRQSLENAIRSVLDQDCDELIIHIWDNHSTDGTKELVEDLMTVHPCIHYTRRPENIGGHLNYCQALAGVRTEFYVGLADDDALLPGFINRALEEFDKDSTLGAVVMQTVHVSESGEELRINPDANWTYGRREPAELLAEWALKSHFEWSSILFKKAAFDAVGGIDESIGLATDVDFQMAVFMRFPAILVPHRAAVYNYHPNQASMTIGIDVISAQRRILDKLAAGSKSRPEFGKAVDLLRKRLRGTFHHMARTCHSLAELCRLCILVGNNFSDPKLALGCFVRGLLVQAGLRERPERIW